jgi:hypothetical protein
MRYILLGLGWLLDCAAPALGENPDWSDWASDSAIPGLSFRQRCEASAGEVQAEISNVTEDLILGIKNAMEIIRGRGARFMSYSRVKRFASAVPQRESYLQYRCLDNRMGFGETRSLDPIFFGSDSSCANNCILV